MQNEEEYNDHDYIENTESQDTDGEIRYIQKVMNKVKTSYTYTYTINIIIYICTGYPCNLNKQQH